MMDRLEGGRDGVDGWVSGVMDGWVDEWMDGCVNRWIDGWVCLGG